jgi:hypothetical protein
MRKGIDGLAMLVQGMLRQDPFSGHLFLFRGRKANRKKWTLTDLQPKNFIFAVLLYVARTAP